LVYCMGPGSILHQMKQWEETDDKEKRQALFVSMTGEPMGDNDAHADHVLAKSVFKRSYQGVFGIIFWFILLGPVGAVLYRCVERLSVVAADKQSDNREMAEQATTLLEILDWIPVRLTTLIFSLVGDFNASFSLWWQKARTGLGTTDDVIYETSIAALSKPVKASADFQQSKAALNLVERGLIVGLVILTIFTLGAVIS
jgi:AmpE protein